MVMGRRGLYTAVCMLLTPAQSVLLSVLEGIKQRSILP